VGRTQAKGCHPNWERSPGKTQRGAMNAINLHKFGKRLQFREDGGRGKIGWGMWRIIKKKIREKENKGT